MSNIQKFEFSSLAALDSFCAEHPAAGRWVRANDSRTGRNVNFYGTENFAAASELLRAGCPDIVGALAAASNRFGYAKSAGRPRPVLGVSGFAAHVPNYITGVPENMINQTRPVVRQKVLRVYYNAAFNCRVDASEIIAVGGAMLAALRDLEKSGYRVELYCCTLTRFSYDKFTFMSARVKNASEPFNLGRLSYAVAHPSFLRRHSFAVRETVAAVGFFDAGHGSSSSDPAVLAECTPAGAVVVSGMDYIKNPAGIETEIKRGLK